MNQIILFFSLFSLSVSVLLFMALPYYNNVGTLFLVVSGLLFYFYVLLDRVRMETLYAVINTPNNSTILENYTINAFVDRILRYSAIKNKTKYVPALSYSSIYDITTASSATSTDNSNTVTEYVSKSKKYPSFKVLGNFDQVILHRGGTVLYFYQLVTETNFTELLGGVTYPTLSLHSVVSEHLSSLRNTVLIRDIEDEIHLLLQKETNVVLILDTPGTLVPSDFAGIVNAAIIKSKENGSVHLLLNHIYKNIISAPITDIQKEDTGESTGDLVDNNSVGDALDSTQ